MEQGIESKKFQKWVQVKLDDDAYYFSLVDEVIQEALVYLFSPKSKVIPEIIEKIAKGATEHGEPLYDAATLTEELHNEFKDLVGWKLVQKWQDARKISITNP